MDEINSLINFGSKSQKVNYIVLRDVNNRDEWSVHALTQRVINSFVNKWLMIGEKKKSTFPNSKFINCI